MSESEDRRRELHNNEWVSIRASGPYVILEWEYDGKMVELARELLDTPFSHACNIDARKHDMNAAALASSNPSAAFVACGDANVDRVCEALRERSRRGQAKYGTTTERTDIDLAGWLQHLQEELLDASVYVERLKAEVALALAEKEAGTTK